MKDELEDFRHTIEETSERLLSMTEAESEMRRADGKWSAKEIMGHLIDSAANNHSRFVTGQLKDNLIFSGYKQEEWVAVQQYQQASWATLVNLWKFYNLHLLHVAACIPEEKLKQPCQVHSLNKIAWKLVDEGEVATLEYLILDYIAHLKNHLRQIFDPENLR